MLRKIGSFYSRGPRDFPLQLKGLEFLNPASLIRDTSEG